MNKAPELLAPAGSVDCMKAAVNAGADAVYMGGLKYGARAFADNPDDAGLLSAIDYLHFHGRKLYLTVNTLFKERELGEELYDFLRPLYEEGLDAVIVQDYGAAGFIHDNFPTLPIHASTQMAVAGKYGAALLKELGISRLVLPRELSLSELRTVSELGEIETECFIHGALCYCYSGQCLMSSIIGGRSGNRGRCAQACRLPFPDEHLLNLKDLNTLSILPDIIDTGVDSLKIEGRMKSARYTAGVTAAYRKYIDMYMECGREGYKVSRSDNKMLSDLFDRGGTTTGYFVKHNGKDMIYKGNKPEYRDVPEALLLGIDEKYIKREVCVKVNVTISIKPLYRAELELCDGNYTVKVIGDNVDFAQGRPLTEEDVRRSVSKLGGSGFAPERIDIHLAPDAFLPVSAINRLRRDAIEQLTKERINGYKRTNI